MSVVLLLASGLMLAVLGASRIDGRWSDLICQNAGGMCGRPSLLAVGVVIALGVYVVQR